MKWNWSLMEWKWVWTYDDWTWTLSLTTHIGFESFQQTAYKRLKDSKKHASKDDHPFTACSVSAPAALMLCCLQQSCKGFPAKLICWLDRAERGMSGDGSRKQDILNIWIIFKCTIYVTWILHWETINVPADSWMKDVNVYILFQISKFREIMAEADYEQRMRELQRQYVDFLDDSDRDGVYDRSVI